MREKLGQHTVRLKFNQLSMGAVDARAGTRQRHIRLQTPYLVNMAKAKLGTRHMTATRFLPNFLLHPDIRLSADRYTVCLLRV
jgi:hypothetical protein